MGARCDARVAEAPVAPTLFDLFRAVSDEARSDDEVVAVVADLMYRRCVRRAGPVLDTALPVA